ncbi:MAG: hypothetical protein OXU81_08660 [Gammaproteobacteria bacterium]|nr:hypothetical protein [Gammaproteobacteria bacterium]
MPAFGNAFTGTPNVDFGISGASREVRPVWRLAPAGPDDSGFELSLDATRSENAGDNTRPEHGIMLRGAIEADRTFAEPAGRPRSAHGAEERRTPRHIAAIQSHGVRR